jgi:hypothetical protein
MTDENVDLLFARFAGNPPASREEIEKVQCRDWKCILAFRRLGSKNNELIAAWMAGTAYAQATNGVILDGEEGRIFTPRSTSARRPVMSNRGRRSWEKINHRLK